MSDRRAQRGFSFSGFVVWAIIIAFVGVICFRVVPGYAEYFAVKQSMQKALDETDSNNAGEIRKNFDKRISVDYVDSIQGKDLDIGKDQGHVVVSATWQKKLHLFFNVSLVLDFDATATK